MIIGIEGQRLYRKKKHGMDIVALELIRNLQFIDKKNQYFVFVKPGPDSKCIPYTPNFKVIELKGGAYPFWEQIALPRAAKAMGCQLLHCTSNTGPIFSKVPLVITLHDIIYLETISIFQKAGTWYQKLGNMYRRWVVPIVAKRSKKVVTVSNYEQERIRNFLGLNNQLITIYNGVGDHFRRVTDIKALSDARDRYRLPIKYLFFLGNTDPKKNTPNVLRAFALFNQKRNDKYKLVMLDYDERELENLLVEIGHPEMRKEIHLTGYLPNLDLPALISQCDVFLYPSLRESFGIPILEGMACGVPVITSNTSSMPEIAGDAALLADPAYPGQIADMIEKIISDEKLRQELIDRGIERARHFSWRQMADKYLALYEDVLNEINLGQPKLN